MPSTKFRTSIEEWVTSTLATAATVWVVYLVVERCIGRAIGRKIKPFGWLFFITWAAGWSLFIAGIVMTIRAEDERHDQGGRLGPAGILAIVVTVVPSPSLLRLMYSYKPGQTAM